MNRITKTKKILLLVLLLNFVVAGFYYFIFSKIREKNEHIAIIENNVIAESAKANMLALAKTRVTETAAKREALEQFFVRKDSVVPFLNYIQTLAADTNVKMKISTVSIEPIDNNDSFEILRLNFEVSGEWRNLYLFGALIELMPYKVMLIKADLEKSERVLSSDKKSSEKPSWKGDFSMNVLKLK